MIPDLAQSLSGHDLGHLQIIAELWGVELEAADFEHGLVELPSLLLSPLLVEETLEILPDEARRALLDLQENGGQIPWALFTRRHGEVRKMGRGRRDRELPYRNPLSAAEALWYREMVARAFFDTPAGPEEFAYIPRDLQPLMSGHEHLRQKAGGHSPPGRPAHKGEYPRISLATDRILDHACTLLAGLRLGLPEDVIAAHLPLARRPLQQLLAIAGFLDEQGRPRPEETRNFLVMGRGDALARLARDWRASKEYKDLEMTPGLTIEGEWEYDPRRGREAILSILARLPADTWWDLKSFVDAIRQENPDFQRRAGDYDSWFVRRSEAGEYLRGFEYWDEVDGALIRFLLTGLLHWLGVVDLGSQDGSEEFTAFRLSRWSGSLLSGGVPLGLQEEDGRATVRSDGRISVELLAPRSTRYQIARFCAWEGVRRGAYRYRLTGKSLEQAHKQGLQVPAILSLLEKAAASVPPNLERALDRWAKEGPAGQIERVAILRLSSPEVLKSLRKSHAARFLGDPLSPTTVIVKGGATEKVMEILAELGYFGVEE